MTSGDHIWAQEFSGAASPINLTWPTDFPTTYQTNSNLCLEASGVQITSSAMAGNRRSRIDLKDISVGSPFGIDWVNIVSGGLQVAGVAGKRYQWGLAHNFDTPAHGPVNHECLPGSMLLYTPSFGSNVSRLVFSIDGVQAGDSLKVSVQFLVLPIPL